MAEIFTLFSGGIGQTILAFVLVFTLVFAILQKSKILGDGKKQIDVLVALAIGLLVVSVGYATDFISKIIPFLGVSLVIILVFLILLGSFFKESEFGLHKGVQVAFGIFIFIVVVIAVLYFTDAWGSIVNFFGQESSLVTNGILLLIVAGVVVLAWFGGGKASSGSSGGKT